ncbi:hypothetical protein E2K98_29820 [Bacillus salipaludis]|uniref:UPF0158 family protein n=1 Tax=Bacillus salipaludis TaxID=2547811 RepID=A0A4R5VHW6_9BACI|nr:UPF0158 family protein [Bacillus salipaludis]MDQ6597972.1 UPF0158 family protein [Bacillus salipaludis]TDK54056.1 hypothetical protein E2K98_29820 [Bacillus salipaludis]
MSIQVKLKDIIEEMEIQFEESRSLLNIKTGEFVLVTSEDLRAAEDEKPFDHLPEWEQENRIIAIDVVENFENYLELPTQYEVNEYEIMENFCLTVSDQWKKESLLMAIKGKGAFRRFKDKIIDFEIEDEWYSYRGECFKQIAIEWCQENKINFIE